MPVRHDLFIEKWMQKIEKKRFLSDFWSVVSQDCEKNRLKRETETLSLG